MPSTGEMAEALYTALQPLLGEVEDLQVYPYFLLNPTPPAIDIYPGDPFQDGTGFDAGRKSFYWTVRARVTTADHDASQQGLLALLDPAGPASVEAALISDQTLGGVVDSLGLDSQTPNPSGYREYVADTAINGRLLGCEWRVQVLT